MPRSRRKKTAPRDALGRFVAAAGKAVAAAGKAVGKAVESVLAPPKARPAKKATKAKAAAPKKRKTAAPKKRKASSKAAAPKKRKAGPGRPKAGARPRRGKGARRPAQARKRLAKLPTPARRPAKREVKKLARKPWAELSAAQQDALRSWRGVKAGETRRDRKFGAMVDTLTNGTKLEKQRIQNQLRRSGTKALARYLRDVLGFDDVDVAEVFAYWFYSE